MSALPTSDVPPPSNPVVTAYDSFIKSTPLVTRYILSIQVVSYVASWFFDPQYALANTLHFTIMRFELYRIVLSPLVNTNFVSLIFSFVSFIGRGKRLENSMGSAAFGWLCVVFAIAVNTIFLLVSFLGYILSDDKTYLFAQSSGIWTILFAIIAMECARAPSHSSQRLFVADIPTIYYPMTLFLLFAFLSGHFSLADFIAVCIGYAAGFGYLDRAKLSDGEAQKWEGSILSNFAQREGWIPHQEALGSRAWATDSQDESMSFLHNMSVFRQSPMEDESSPSPSSFTAGVGGRVLGGGATRRGHSSDPRAARLQVLEHSEPSEKVTGKDALDP